MQRLFGLVLSGDVAELDPAHPPGDNLVQDGLDQLAVNALDGLAGRLEAVPS